MDINHRPLFKTDQTVKELSRKEGVAIKYVATTELLNTGYPVDVFYRSTPHPKFGNWYFGLYFNYMADSVMICDADCIEDLTFAMIQDENHAWHYSRFNHDFVSVGEDFIDGGRTCVRSSKPATTFKVVGERFEKVDTEEHVW